MSKQTALGLLCALAFPCCLTAQEIVIMREKKPKTAKLETAKVEAAKPETVTQDRARLQKALEAKTQFHVEKAKPVQSVNAPVVQTQPGVARPVIVHVQPQQPAAPQQGKPDAQKALPIGAPPSVMPPRKPESTVASSATTQSPRQTLQAKPEVQTARTIAVPPSTMQSRKPETQVASVSPSQAKREAEAAPIQSINLQGATAFTKLANGFDFAVGKPDAKNYYKARGFKSHGHMGEDWDGIRGGDTDLGDPIYCIGDGVVVFARDCHMGWGNVVIIRHSYREGGMVRNVDSLYGHCERIVVHRGQVVSRGQQIATIGTAHGLYDA